MKEFISKIATKIPKESGGEGDKPGPGRISIPELREMIKRREDMYIIDVRTLGEYTWGHIAGAMCIPLKTILDNKTIDYRGKIVLYCDTGDRSSRARKMLEESGLEGVEVLDLIGGIKDWKKHGGVLIND